MRSINELKALTLHCCKDISKECLCGVYVDCSEDTYTLIGADDHSMLWKAFKNDDWGLLRIILQEEYGFCMPIQPENGYLNIDKKIRNASSCLNTIFSTPGENLPYVNYKLSIPDFAKLSRNPMEVPIFRFDLLERIHKTYKLLCYDKSFFLPEWCTSINTCIVNMNDNWHLLAMPCRATLENDVYWSNYLKELRETTIEDLL